MFRKREGRRLLRRPFLDRLSREGKREEEQVSSETTTVVEEVRPESGRTFATQSQESYCLECVERHTMMATTELRHAIDRYRTAGKMTSGVTEKVRGALEEINGIVKDVKDTDNASPEVKEGLGEILNEVRWISKTFGISGKGLTRGYGDMEDLEAFRGKVMALQLKAYALVEKCPSCKIIGERVAEKI